MLTALPDTHTEATHRPEQLALLPSRLPTLDGVATDLDGTLLQTSGRVSGFTKRIFRRLLDRDRLVFLATARGPWDALPIARSLGIRQPLIGLNGAAVFDVSTGALLRSSPLPAKALHDLLMILLEMPHVAVAADTANRRHATPEWSRRYLGNRNIPVTALGSESLAGEVLCVMIRAEQQRVTEVEETLRSHFDQIRFTSSAEGLLECSALGATKANAVEWASNRWESSLRRLVAFGDMPNDLEMLQAAALAYSVANASRAVRDVVPSVSRSNDSDAVAYQLAILLDEGVL